MKSTIKHVSETRALVTVVLGKEELKAAEQVALVRLGKNMKVAGFRKGKAPIAMVAKNADPARRRRFLRSHQNDRKKRPL